MSYEIEDIQEALKARRVVRSHGPYRIQIGNEQLEFRGAVLQDPVPTGRQIIEAAGLQPVTEYLVLQMLSSGELENMRPDETTDLRANEVERFLVFRNDRSFRFELDGKMFEWGSIHISGVTLKKLGGVNPVTYGVWLDVPHGEDRLVGDDELFDISAPGVEKFFTSIKTITIIVNGRPKEVCQLQLSFYATACLYRKRIAVTA